MGAILGAIVLLCFIVMNPVLLAISLAIIVIAFVIAIVCHIKGIRIPPFPGPRGRRRSYRRKSKSLWKTIFDDQARTQRQNAHPRGVRSGLNGSQRRR